MVTGSANEVGRVVGSTTTTIGTVVGWDAFFASTAITTGNVAGGGEVIVATTLTFTGRVVAAVDRRTPASLVDPPQETRSAAPITTANARHRLESGTRSMKE